MGFGNELLNFDVRYVNQQSHLTRECRNVSQPVILHWIIVIVALPALCAVMICSGSWWLLCDRAAAINICTSGTKLKFRCLSTEIMDRSSCRDVRRCCARCLGVCTVGCRPIGSTASSLLAEQMLRTDRWQLTKLCSSGYLVYDYRKYTRVLCVYMYIFNLCVRARA
jgi:hypothetical protein